MLNNSDLTDNNLDYVYRLLGDLDTSFKPPIRGIPEAEALADDRTWILNNIDLFF